MLSRKAKQTQIEGKFGNGEPFRELKMVSGGPAEDQVETTKTNTPLIHIRAKDEGDQTVLKNVLNRLLCRPLNNS